MVPHRYPEPTIGDPVVDLTSRQLIANLSDATGVKQDSVKIVLAALGDATQKALAANGSVALPGIGKLAASTRAARVGVRPGTKEPLPIAAKRVAKLKPGAELRDALAV